MTGSTESDQLVTQSDVERYNLDLRLVASGEFAARFVVLLLVGFLGYGWLSFSINSVNAAPTWVHISHDDAYLWLTASGVLVLALAASSSLSSLDRHPEVEDADLSARLERYDQARLRTTRFLMRSGSTAGAGIAMLVAWAGATDYLNDIGPWDKAPLDVRLRGVASAAFMLALAVLLVFTVCTLNTTIWSAPRSFRSTSLRYSVSVIDEALTTCGVRHPREWRESKHDDAIGSRDNLSRLLLAFKFMQKWSLELLVVVLPLICTFVFLVIVTLRYQFSDELPAGNFLTFCGYFLLFDVPLVLCWCGSYATHLMAGVARKSRMKTDTSWKMPYRLISFAWAFGFVAVAGSTWIVYPTARYMPLMIIGLAVILCVATSISTVAGGRIPMLGVRARTARYIRKMTSRSRRLSLEEHDRRRTEARAATTPSEPETQPSPAVALHTDPSPLNPAGQGSSPVAP